MVKSVRKRRHPNYEQVGGIFGLSSTEKLSVSLLANKEISSFNKGYFDGVGGQAEITGTLPSILQPVIKDVDVDDASDKLSLSSINNYLDTSEGELEEKLDAEEDESENEQEQSTEGDPSTDDEPSIASTDRYRNSGRFLSNSMDATSLLRVLSRSRSFSHMFFGIVCFRFILFNR